MFRQLLTAQKLQEEMLRKLRTRDEVIEADIEVLIGAPTWRAPTPDGCNWHVEYTPRYEGLMPAIQGVIRQTQAAFNLV